MEIGSLWIGPRWVIPPPDRTVVRLEPGLAFGSGRHPTTRLCLERLAAAPPAGIDVIDYGCGSGILAVTAAALGARRVLALDIDPPGVARDVRECTEQRCRRPCERHRGGSGGAHDGRTRVARGRQHSRRAAGGARAAPFGTDDTWGRADALGHPRGTGGRSRRRLSRGVRHAGCRGERRMGAAGRQAPTPRTARSPCCRSRAVACACDRARIPTCTYLRRTRYFSHRHRTPATER